MKQQKGPIIKMEKISKSFGAVKAVQTVHLELYAGEIIGLVGDNGSGKTTLMKVLSGIYQPVNLSVGFLYSFFEAIVYIP